MTFLIPILTFILLIDCLLLILLVLIQLPKKEAGAGVAFGGGATDALFGAGSGNMLTKITKYAAGIFLVLAMLVAFMQRAGSGRGGVLEQNLGNLGNARPVNSAPAGPSTPSTGTPLVTNAPPANTVTPPVPVTDTNK